MSSSFVQHWPNLFGQPLVCLLSPEQVPSSLHGKSGGHSNWWQFLELLSWYPTAVGHVLVLWARISTRFLQFMLYILMDCAHILTMINSLWPSDTTWRHRTGIDIGWGNGLLPGSTKPLPEPMLTYHQYSPVTFIRQQFHQRYLSHQLRKLPVIIWNFIQTSQGPLRWPFLFTSFLQTSTRRATCLPYSYTVPLWHSAIFATSLTFRWHSGISVRHKSTSSLPRQANSSHAQGH